MTCMTSLALPFEKELVVDLFAGGGGASSGIAEAYREPDVAVNHNPIALAVHRANHQQTEHYVADVFEVDPILATCSLTKRPASSTGRPSARLTRSSCWVTASARMRPGHWLPPTPPTSLSFISGWQLNVAFQRGFDIGIPIPTWYAIFDA